VARALLLIPPSRQLFVDAEPIEPGYPRQYTPAEMRAWSDDLARLYRTVEQDRTLPPSQRRLDAWLATPPDRLPADARGALAARDHLLSEPDRGIKGSLRADGRVELRGGRHRAHYILERQGDPVPVWVDCPDAQRLEQFRAACETSVARSRPDLRMAERSAEPARVPEPVRDPVRSAERSR
jgi:hypothetical protein